MKRTLHPNKISFVLENFCISEVTQHFFHRQREKPNESVQSKCNHSSFAKLSMLQLPQVHPGTRLTLTLKKNVGFGQSAKTSTQLTQHSCYLPDEAIKMFQKMLIPKHSLSSSVSYRLARNYSCLCWHKDGELFFQVSNQK